MLFDFCRPGLISSGTQFRVWKSDCSKYEGWFAYFNSDSDYQLGLWATSSLFSGRWSAGRLASYGSTQEAIAERKASSRPECFLRHLCAWTSALVSSHPCGALFRLWTLSPVPNFRSGPSNSIQFERPALCTAVANLKSQSQTIEKTILSVCTHEIRLRYKKSVPVALGDYGATVGCLWFEQ